ncbi:MAG: hypothetical protein SGJ01_13630 [Gemmatimonadota bacterium]|nr:hypothetical protein [Gemmatimonadota bacterium]
MIVKKIPTLVNGVYSMQLDVELDAVETAYARAYGEPKVDVAGVIAYTPSGAIAPGQLTVATEENLGTVPVAGVATAAPGFGSNAYELTASGTFPTALTSNPGFFKGNAEVIGDFEIKVKLIHAEYVTDPAAADGFLRGLAVMEDNEVDDPAVLFGWGGHQSVLKLSLRQRTVKGAALSEAAQVARTAGNGIFFRLTRIGNVLTARYSYDNGTVWAVLGAVSLVKQAVRVGLFFNSGRGASDLNLISDLSLVNTASVSAGQFTIGGNPDLRSMRAQSPHEFSLDSRLDSEALLKVTGWAATITSRLQAAKATLLTNPNPSTVVGSVDQV